MIFQGAKCQGNVGEESCLVVLLLFLYNRKHSSGFTGWSLKRVKYSQWNGARLRTAVKGLTLSMKTGISLWILEEKG